MTSSSVDRVFKISVLAGDEALFAKLKDGPLGADFNKSFIETKGSAFGMAKFPENSEKSLIAQFWMLYPGEQWLSIRQLYYRGTSGLILLYNPSDSKSKQSLQKLIREFVSFNKGITVPMFVFAVDTGNIAKDQISMKSKILAKDIMRWSGFRVDSFTLSDNEEEIKAAFMQFMDKIKNWRAKSVVFATLKIYFALDSIANKTRSIVKILHHLRHIYVAHLYELISDDELLALIREAAAEQYFKYDGKDIIYNKPIDD
jgi:hypothetical protein